MKYIVNIEKPTLEGIEKSRFVFDDDEDAMIFARLAYKGRAEEDMNVCIIIMD